MNQLEIGKTYLLSAINGVYPRHSLEVLRENAAGNFVCHVRYNPDDDSPATCTFYPNGVSVFIGEDCCVDWDKVNFPSEPVAVAPCVAHAECGEQMQTSDDSDSLTLLGAIPLALRPAPLHTGVKLDNGKPKPRLLHESMAGAVASVVDVLSFGARKYSDDNWKNVEPKRYTDALYRHLNAHHKGESNDAESGLPHLAHAACCVLFLLHHEVNK